MTTPTTTAELPQPFSLIGAFEDHLRFQGRTPRKLSEKLHARAVWEHENRLAQIRRMGAQLERLEPFLAELAKRGVPIHVRDIRTWDGGPSPTLRIVPPIFSKDDKLYAALVDLGFLEVERRDHSSYSSVHLKHGRSLRVWIDVTASVLAQPAAPAVVAPAAATTAA